MQSELQKRLEILRIPVISKMRDIKGPCELGGWWEQFIGSIPADAGFEDLNLEIQNLITSWEKEILANSDENRSSTIPGPCEP